MEILFCRSTFCIDPRCCGTRHCSSLLLRQYPAGKWPILGVGADKKERPGVDD